MSQGTLAKVLFLCLLQFPAQSTRPLVYANSATANSLIFRKTDPYLLGFPFGMVLVRDAGAVVEELCVARTAEPKPVPSWITILSLRGGGSSTRLDALLDSVSARNPIRKKSSGVLKQSPKKRLSSGLSMEGSAVEEQHEMTSKDEFSRSMSGRNCGSSRGDSSQGEYVQSVEDCVAKDSASKRGAGVVGVDWKHVRTLRMGSNTSEPFDVAVGPNKSLYITDSLYHKIGASISFKC